MVIQCPHCRAQFKLPTHKVKPGGTKVRCTKCKMLFIVTPPQGNAADKAPIVNAAPESGTLDDFGADEFFSDSNEGDEFLLAEAADDEDVEAFFALADGDGETGELQWQEDAEGELFEPLEEPLEEPLFGGPPVEAEPSVADSAQQQGSEITLLLAPEEPSDKENEKQGIEQDAICFDDDFGALPTPGPPSEGRRRSSRLRTGLLVGLLLLATGLYIYPRREQLSAYWQERLIGWQLIPEPPAEGRELRPSGLSGFYVENRYAGRLFVVQGRVVNESTEARAILVVQGTLYGGDGTVLARQKAFCGNPMSREQLSDWSLMRINERMQNQFGEMLANLSLAPRRSIPFTLVFPEPAAEVAEFEVIVLSSEPVIQ